VTIGTTAKMMGGVVGESMGGVARDEEQFFEVILT